MPIPTLPNNARARLIRRHTIGSGFFEVDNPAPFGNPSSGAPVRITALPQAVAYSPALTSDQTTIFDCINIQGNLVYIDQLVEDTVDQVFVPNDILEVRLTGGILDLLVQGSAGNVTLTGDVTGNGVGSVSTTLVPVGTPGTYSKVLVDAKGRVTSGGNLVFSDLPAIRTIDLQDWTATNATLIHNSGNESISGVKTFSQTIIGSIAGNAATVSNGVYTTGSYADPAWITSLSVLKLGAFIATGTTTPRTLLDRAADIYNVRDFGAVGNGIADDRAAIQAAIDVANINGGCVYLPRGTYIILPSTPLVLKSNIWIYGDGPATIIKVKDNSSDYPWIFHATSLLTDFVISDLRIDQNAAGNTTCDVGADVGHFQFCFYITNFNRLKFHNVKFDYTGINCLFLAGPDAAGNAATDIVVTDCRFQAHRGHTTTPFYDSTAVYTEAVRTEIDRNVFVADIADRFATSFELHGPRASASGNLVDGFGCAGYIVSGFDAGQLDPERAITFSDNVIIRAENAIHVVASGGVVLKGVTITGNTIALSQLSRDAAMAAGVIVSDDGTPGNSLEGLAITGNRVAFEVGDTRTTISGGGALSYQAGILINASCPVKGVTLGDNTILDSTGTGLFIGTPSSSITGLTATGNTLIDCGRNPNYSAGLRTVYILRGTLAGVRVSNNAIVDTGASTPNGLYYYISDAPTADGVIVGPDTLNARARQLATLVSGAPLTTEAIEGDAAFVHTFGVETVEGFKTFRDDSGIAITSKNAGGTPGFQIYDQGVLRLWFLNAASNPPGLRYSGILSYGDSLDCFAQGATPFRVWTNGVLRWIVSPAGTFYPSVDNTYDLGDPSFRLRDGYFAGTVHAANFGGNGSGLTNINASALATGTVPLLQLPTTNLNITSHYGAISADTDPGTGTITFDLSASDWHTVTLTGNRTLVLSGVGNGQQFAIVITQDGSGSHTVTWFNTITWMTAGGAVPQPQAAANKVSTFTFKQISTGNYLGWYTGSNA